MKLHSWQRRKYDLANGRGPDRWTADNRVEKVSQRPRSATFRQDRYIEPEPMPEPKSYRERTP